MDRKSLLRLIELLADHIGRSRVTVAKNLGSYSMLPKRLEEGRGLNVATMERLASEIARQWPDDLEWPSDIPRPEVDVTS